MKVSTTFALLASVSMTMAACTGRSPRPVQVENQPRPAANSETPGDRSQPGAQPTTPVIQPTTPDANGNVNADVEISKQYLESKVANIDLNNLTYKFSYLSKTQSDKIVFDASGKATLSFKSLPAKQAGTVTLEILEGSVVKLRGTAENVTLQVGVANKITLELKPVDNGGGGNGGGNNDTTDLTLEVSLGNNGGGTTPPTGGGGGGGTTPPTDPVANWDGKSNQGNSRWKIVSLDN